MSEPTKVLWCFKHNHEAEWSQKDLCVPKPSVVVPKDAPSITIDDDHPMGRLATLEQVASTPPGVYVRIGDTP